MTDPDGPSVLAALGLHTDSDYAVPDDVWSAALAVALDPDTPVADASTVPIIDDHGTVPDTDAASDASIDTHHGDHGPAVDLGDGSHDHDSMPHDDTGSDTDHHVDPAHHDTGDHSPGHDDPGHHDTDWHI